MSRCQSRLEGYGTGIANEFCSDTDAQLSLGDLAMSFEDFWHEGEENPISRASSRRSLIFSDADSMAKSFWRSAAIMKSQDDMRSKGTIPRLSGL